MTTPDDSELRKRLDLAKMRATLLKFHPHWQPGQEDDSSPLPALADDLAGKSDALAIAPHRHIELRTITGAVLIADFVKDCAQRGLAKTTITRYVYVCKEFFRHAGSLKPAEIRPLDIREYLGWMMGRGATDHTLSQTLSAIRSMFRFAEMMEYVSVSPARAVQTRRYRRTVPHVLTDSEVNRLIDAAQKPRDKALLETMYATGCRVSEIAGMRVQDVSWSNRSILVLGKGNKERLVPIGGRAVKSLEEYLAGRERGFLFQGEGVPDQGGSVRRLKCEKWQGRWAVDYVLDPNGKVSFRLESQLLGDVSSMSQEEATQKLRRLLKGKTRPRPIQDEAMTARHIREIVAGAGLLAKLERRVHPHMLRHCCATHLLDHGADIVTIGAILGHVSLSTRPFIRTSARPTCVKRSKDVIHTGR